MVGAAQAAAPPNRRGRTAAATSCPASRAAPHLTRSLSSTDPGDAGARGCAPRSAARVRHLGSGAWRTRREGIGGAPRGWAVSSIVAPAGPTASKDPAAIRARSFAGSGTTGTRPFCVSHSASARRRSPAPGRSRSRGRSPAIGANALDGPHPLDAEETASCAPRGSPSINGSDGRAHATPSRRIAARAESGTVHSRRPFPGP